MKNHGTIEVNKDILSAFYAIEELEVSAHIAVALHELGVETIT